MAARICASLFLVDDQNYFARFSVKSLTFNKHHVTWTKNQSIEDSGRFLSILTEQNNCGRTYVLSQLCHCTPKVSYIQVHAILYSELDSNVFLVRRVGLRRKAVRLEHLPPLFPHAHYVEVFANSRTHPSRSPAPEI